MSKYELALVVNAKIDDEARGAVVDNAKALIERFGGKVGETEEWGKRKLAYEIQKMNEGYYYFIQFEAEAGAPAELESRMRIADNVLRYLIVKKDEKDDFKVSQDKEPAAEAKKEEAAPAEEAAKEEAAPAEEAKTEEAASTEEKAD